jgi:hypothetical protein
MFDGPQLHLEIRVASEVVVEANKEIGPDIIYYDLYDRDWRCVKMTKEGWTIEQQAPILFARYNN